MMEESQGDSDASDSWSFVDYKPEEHTSELTNSFKPNADSKSIDECFELTELSEIDQDIQQESSNQPLRNDCEEDTDGISVISDDDEYVSWKQAAHENYRNTMMLLDTSSDSPFLSRVSQNRCLSSLDDNEDVDGGVEKPLTSSDAITSSTSTLMASSDVTEDSEVDDSWQETCTNFLNKYFFTSAVFAAIACIALAHLLKTYNGSKDKMAEMMEVLERLRVENEQLKFQLQDLTSAYAALEMQIKETNLKGSTERKSALAGELEILKNNADTRIAALAADLHHNLQLIGAETIIPIQEKITRSIARLSKGEANTERAVRRLAELNEKLKRKIQFQKRSNVWETKDEGIKIIQWFAESSRLHSEPERDGFKDGPSRVSPEILNRDGKYHGVSENINMNEINDIKFDTTSESDKTKKMSRYQNKVRASVEKENKQIGGNKKKKRSKNKNEQKNDLDDLLWNGDKLGDKIEKKNRKRKLKETKMKEHEESKLPNLKLDENIEVPDGPMEMLNSNRTQNYNNIKEKYPPEDKNKRMVGNNLVFGPRPEPPSWYFEMGKVRENFRKEEREQKRKLGAGRPSCRKETNKTGDWYLERGKAREHKRNLAEKSMWYFRRMEMYGSM